MSSFLGVGVTDRQEKKEGPAQLTFGSDSESRASTALSVPVEGASRRQRLQRYLLRCIRQSSLRKPIDTDSKMIFLTICSFKRFIHSIGSLHLTWLLFVAMAYLYNFISIPLRIAFPVWDKGQKYMWIWMVIDYGSDVLYIIDICFVQTRIKYLENGLWVV